MHYEIIVIFIIICHLHQTMQVDNFSGDKILSPRTVKSKYGALRGVLISFTDHKPANSDSTNLYPNPPINLSSVEAFLGVPYATSPISSLRFMPPVTPSHWRGTRLANKLSPVCPQKLPGAFRKNYESKLTKNEARMDYVSRLLPFLESQSEDCLYLNVYLPFIKDAVKKPKLPVMVFVHGESYNWGTGNAYDGTILASYGEVVVVTMNYRLGIFGFLPTTVDGATRGNYGLMDVMAALHWVHDNINEIGGDANNVTLVGHNRGASLVNLLMISPMGRGLFSKAILMSGSALSSWSIAREAESYAKSLSKAVNCPNYDNIVMVECLRTKPVEELLKVDMETEDSFRSAFGPIIDGLLVPSEPRILMESENDSSHHLSYTYPNIKQATGLFKKDPHHLMFGVTRVEAPLLFSPEEEKHGIDFERRDAILRTLVRNVVNYYEEVISLTLINEYTDWSVPSEHPINILDSLIDILGDALVVAPVTNVANMHFKHQQQRSQSGDKRGDTASNANSEGPKVFSYVFVYQSEANGYSARLGCVHGDELPFIFGAPLAHYYLSKTLGFFPKNYTKPEVTLSETVMSQWTNFVKFGNPNVNKNSRKDRFESFLWSEFDIVQRKYLMIGMKPKIRDHYHSHRLSFWLNLIPKLEKHGKEESDHLKRQLQDQGTLEDRQVSVFERISLKFLSSLRTPGETKLFESLPGVSTTPKSVRSVNTKGSSSGESSGHSTSTSVNSTATSESTSMKVHQGNQSSTALSITIAIGLLFLLINLLIFVAVYYHLSQHRDKKKYPNVGYVDIAQHIPRTTCGRQISVDSVGGQSSIQQQQQCEQYFCETHHHLCGYATTELEFNNCSGGTTEPVTIHCVVSDDGKPGVSQCSICCMATNETNCDRSHSLSIIREHDEHL